MTEGLVELAEDDWSCTLSGRLPSVCPLDKPRRGRVRLDGSPVVPLLPSPGLLFSFCPGAGLPRELVVVVGAAVGALGLAYHL